MKTKQEEINKVVWGVYFHGIQPAEALQKLSDLGVVIKVDRKLPGVPITSNSSAEFVPPYSQGYAQCRQDMAGYEAVIPLIEVERNI